MTIGLILGAAVWANGPSPTLLRRTRHAAQLYHAGRISHLVACGGIGQHPPSEAEVMRDILLNDGVPGHDITLEDRSTTTGENIRNAIGVLPALKAPNEPRKVVIITDWYHAPRARLIARRAGLHPSSASPALSGAKPWPQTKGALREIPAYLAYLLRLKG